MIQGLSHVQTRRDFVRTAGAGLAGMAGALPAAGQVPDQIAIVPRPRFIDVKTANRISLRPDLPVFVGKSLFAMEHRWVPRVLLRKLREKPPEPSLVPAANAALPSPCVLIGAPEDHNSLRVLFEKLKRRLGPAHGTRLGEGYLLSSGPEGIRLAADTPAGAFYGVQSVVQTLNADRAIPALELADAPAVPFRGIHFSVRDPQDIPILQRFIREVLPRHKANTLIAQVNYGFRFRSHPEINEATMLGESEARSLATLCRDYNIRLIPLINCFGHQSSGSDRLHGFLRAYPQFNETPCKKDVLFYSWCASDPRIAPIAFELIDELVTAFEADGIHLGMDEVVELGACPFCRSKTPAELFAKVVNEFHQQVVGKRKLQMLMWGDRLIDGRKTPYNPMNGSRNGTHPALHMIPKDILVCDWHYHLHDTYPSADMFSEAGLDFTACGWQKKDAIQAYSSYAQKHGGKHYRGYLASNWSPFARIARYLVEGAAQADSAQIRNFAECFRIGTELAWTGT